MDEKGATRTQQKAQQQAPSSPFSMLLVMMFMLLFITNQDLRNDFGTAAGGILTPLFGFDNQYPHWTLFCSGLTMIMITTSIRHIMMDWVKLAEIQAKFKSFNKKMNELRKAQNFSKLQELSERHRPELMQMQADMQSYNMKPMAFTMLVAIPIFVWLNSFISGIPDGATYVSMPWEPKWWLDGRMLLPYWVALYSLVTIPVGQTYQRILKYYSFKKRLQDEEGTRHIRANSLFDVCQLAFVKLDEDGVIYKEGKKKIVRAEEELKEKNFSKAIELCEDASLGIEDVKKDHFEAQTELDVTKEIMKRESHLDLHGAQKNLEEAERDFERGEYSSSLFYARKAKRIIRELSDMQSEKDKFLGDIRGDLKKALVEFPNLDISKVDAFIDEAKKSKSKDSINENIEQARREIKKAKQYVVDSSEMGENIDKALEKARALKIYQSDELEEIRELKHHLREKDFHNYLMKGEKLLREINERLDMKEEIQSDLSHAELLIKNAQSFGGDVATAERHLQEARDAFDSGKDDLAESLAKQTIREAEKAKEQIKKYS